MNKHSEYRHWHHIFDGLSWETCRRKRKPKQFLSKTTKHQVFRLEDKTGIIPGGGSAFLRWRFLPLEAKEYVLRVAVRTTEHHDEWLGERFGDRPEEQSLEITLRGVGYDPRSRDPHR